MPAPVILSPQIIAWFVVYQTLGVLLFGSLFIAVGAACTSAQEAQTLLMPVMVLAMIPLFALLNVITEPDGPLAVSGGAAANRLLRRELPAWSTGHGRELRLVPLVYAGDNAAMIAHAALLRYHRGLADDPFAAEAESRIPI